MQQHAPYYDGFPAIGWETTIHVQPNERYTMPHIDTILCDQHGMPVQINDIPDDKVRKRVGKDSNGFIVVTINTDDMEQSPGPTDDTVSIWQFMRDKAGTVKMAEHMIVQKF